MNEVLVTEQEIAADARAAVDYRLKVDEIRMQATALDAAAGALEEEILTLKDSVEDIRRDELIAAHEHVYQQLDEIRDQQYAMVATALDHQYTVDEIRKWYLRAEGLADYHPRITAKVLEDLAYMRRVPNAPFRDRLAEISAREEIELQDRSSQTEHYTESPVRLAIMSAMGWDDRALKRTLGINPRPAGGGERGGSHKSVSLFIDYNAASLLARTLGLKPHAAGI
jgi:hypothetical protein